MKKRLLSFLCTLALCLGLLPATVFAATPEGVWTDYADDSFAGGAGTEVDPYRIATAEQLAKLAQTVNSGLQGSSQRDVYFKLTSDIDLSAHRWVPIGYGDVSSTPFSGFFDGDGHKLTGMFVDESATKKNAGLFGVITAVSDKEASVKNLTIENAEVLASDYENDVIYYGAGILAGSINKDGIFQGTSVPIVNCHVSGSVKSGMQAGGLIGSASYVSISDCTAAVTVKGHSMTGGLIGNSYDGTYDNCTVSGTVESSGWSTGGFVGVTDFSTTIKKCMTDVDVSAGDWNLGGFVGYVGSSEISNCVAYGDVTSNVTGWNPKAGGFTGTNIGTVTNCHALGMVTANAPGFEVGGFIGSDEDGTTSGCSFSSEKNPGLNGVGFTQTPGTNDISEDLDTNGVLANICEDYYDGHQYSSEWTVETEATCTTDGSKYQPCERCGAKGNVTVILATGHSLIKTEAQDPTCTKAGNSAYWTCENCEKVFGDEKGETETSLAETVVQATGHNYVNGICTKCGAVLSNPAPQPSGPSTGNSNGWTEIEEEVTETTSGTVTVDMNGTTEVPAEVFEAVAGKDVTLELDMGGGVKWEINGQDIPADADLTSLDLGVTLNTSDIPLDVINMVTGEKSTVQLSLAHDGEFGFTLTLTAPLGVENKGLWANLYHYNTTQKQMLFETSAQVDASGNVALKFTHASEYAIVLDESSHELPFTDTAKGAWYQGAVEYVYRNGIMTGTSATTFEPNAPLSRAMVAQILYNLEGQPTVEGESTFADASGHWAATAIAWAQETGVVNGYEDNTFRPNRAVSREELAQMLYNYAKYKEIILPIVGDLSKFPDGEEVSSWAQTAMEWATGLGAINGYEDNTLRPGGNTTRAEAASMILGMATTLMK